MEAVEYLRRQIERMRRLTDSVLKDLTDEQLNWIPPGVTNPIRATLIHVFTGEDYFVQSALRGTTTIWETERWGDRFGLTTPLGQDPWEELRRTPISLATLLTYQQAVYAATDAYLADLTAADLNRSVRLYGNERMVADVFTLIVVHAASHMGEIAALKGVQGGKGLPF